MSPSDDAYKETIFRRVRAVCQFEIGQYVKIRGTSHRGKIKNIYSNLEDVVWEKNRPYFIEVEFPDGFIRLANPSQIHRRRAK